jgi:aryl-alcohol dehydrogenase-like predicted oxidoreductase
VRYRQLGSSDLHVSTISLGTWKTYGGGGVPDDIARTCIDAAFDSGINFIDTANVYSGGGAESFLGEVLPSRPRDSYILATKLRFSPDGSRENEGLSAAQVHKQIDASLQRLRQDYVDLYQCHRYDPSAPLEETMEALTEIVRAGKVRYIGFSEFSPEQIQASLDHSRERGLEQFVSSQPQYSLLWREPEAEVIPLCRENGISQIVWSPLAEGVLTGKYRPGTPPPDSTRGIRRDDDTLEGVQRLVLVAERLGVEVSQLALAWVLRDDNVASAIVGASRPGQVRENAAAADIDLDPETLAEIEQIFPA